MTARTLKIRALATLMLVALAGLCLPAPAGTLRHDADPADYLDLAGDYPSVGRIAGVDASGGFGASATLIAPNWALTAAHVVDGATSLDFTLGGTTYSATSWVAHNKWDGSLDKGYDIGLIQFTDDVSAASGITPATLYTGSDELGQIGTSVGFGMTGTGLTGATLYDGLARAGENVLDRWLRTPGKTPRVFLSDFDNPLDPADSSWDSATPLGLEYLIAPGDSGGGLFLSVGGEDLLAGVHSFGWGILDGDPDSDYGDASGHTRVSAFGDWIDEILNPGSGGGKGNGGGNGNGKGNGGGKGKPTLDGLLSEDPADADAIDPLFATPEPASAACLALGALALLRRRRK